MITKKQILLFVLFLNFVHLHAGAWHGQKTFNEEAFTGLAHSQQYQPLRDYFYDILPKSADKDEVRDAMQWLAKQARLHAPLAYIYARSRSDDITKSRYNTATDICDIHFHTYVAELILKMDIARLLYPEAISKTEAFTCLNDRLTDIRLQHNINSQDREAVKTLLKLWFLEYAEQSTPSPIWLFFVQAHSTLNLNNIPVIGYLLGKTDQRIIYTTIDATRVVGGKKVGDLFTYDPTRINAERLRVFTQFMNDLDAANNVTAPQIQNTTPVNATSGTSPHSSPLTPQQHATSSNVTPALRVDTAAQTPPSNAVDDLVAVDELTNAPPPASVTPPAQTGSYVDNGKKKKK